MFINLHSAVKSQRDVLLIVLEKQGTISKSHIDTVFNTILDKIANSETKLVETVIEASVKALLDSRGVKCTEK